MRPETLGVIGLGAIGGSVAWQAVRAGVPRVVGYTLAPHDGAAALRSGAITELASDARRVVRAADLVIVAVPPAATVTLLSTLAGELAARDAFVTDVASVKGPIVAAAAGLGLAARFAGSHPFAGTHAHGFGAARPDLLSGAVVYVTPVEGGDRAASEIADCWKRVFRAEAVRLSAEQHDGMLAWTSHLPQVVASALAGALAGRGPRGATVGTGARATSRLAASSVEMWTDVLLMNRDRVAAALDGFETTLGELRAALSAGDAGAVRSWLAAGHQWRTRLGE